MRTLEELLETLGNRRLSVCRELTKKYETVFRTDLEQAIRHYTAEEPRGECVLVLEGRDVKELQQEKQAEWEKMTPAGACGAL